MAETLLNWAVLLASSLVLVGIAWLGFRDLRSLGESRAPRTASGGAYAGSWDPAPEPRDDAPPAAHHLLRIDYARGGALAGTQYVTEERSGFIGTETQPGMGPGVLVRHVRLRYDGGGFALENRHTSRPLPWRADGGRSGEVAPGGTLPVDGELDLLLGEWVVTCREER